MKQYQIEGRFIQEEKLLSEGGYGYIWRVIDVNTREVFALKKSVCQGDERYKVARNELTIMKNLPKHPNIIQCYGGCFIQEQGQQVCLILLEFCNGGSIFDLMAKDPNARLPESQLISIMKQITQGLKAMHQVKLAHRDIKIENVLFQNGQCKLCDFGSASTQIVDFAKVDKSEYANYEEQFEKNTTMMYRPPEMCDLYLKYEVNEKVDVWMLGCVLFTICFFIHPFQESSKLAISTATYNMPKQSIYSEKLKDFIRLMLTPNPKLRPSIYDVEHILNSYDRINQIQLNPQALEIKNREVKLQQEMQVYEQNSHKIKKFDGDIPMEELMKIQQKIKSQTKHQTQSVPKTNVSKPQQQSYISHQKQQQQQHQQQQQNPFQQAPYIQQQQQKSPISFGFESFGQQQKQQQPTQDIWGAFNQPFNSSASSSPFGWDQFQQQPPQLIPQPQASTDSSNWEMSSVSTSHEASTQASMNVWDVSPPRMQQSHSLPQSTAQLVPQVIDLIGLEESQPSNKIDLSNIIL